MHFVDLPGGLSRSFSRLASFRFPGEPTTLLPLQGHVCGALSALCFYLIQDTLNSTVPWFCISVFMFGYAESSLLSGLFPSCGSGGCIRGFSLQWILWWSTGARSFGFGSGTGLRNCSSGLESTGLIVSALGRRSCAHVESSQTCRWILYY